MGLMQREKGKRFERQIADVLRKRFPWALVRRGSQAERADMPDVFIARGEGPAGVLQRLWLECQDARKPTPFTKLEQAERDVQALTIRAYPIAVWHRLGERTSHATMRLGTLRYLLGDQAAMYSSHARSEYVTLTLDGLLSILEGAIASGVS